ncbi:MAG: P-protein [Firmicutes bacterium ADurb.Bin300]|nr:MAG: P-protein [Firmicutes bacterium ADurb.Bin300]
MDLQDYRKQIDEIDEELVKLFCSRMEVAAKIGEFKKENNIPILDYKREREKLNYLSDNCPQTMSDYIRSLYSLIFELSSLHQRKQSCGESALQRSIVNALENTEKAFPGKALVACQGVEGSFSQQACEKLFDYPNLMFFNSFDSVFAAIDKGLCRYGVLPLENSTAGSVNKIYDLMIRYDFSIVKSTRLKIDHFLLSNKGTAFADIKEIFTHEQAIAQCSDFLRTLENVKITPCENTALAAKMVFESGRKDVAAISSRACADIYDLQCIKESIQDQGSNYTRFICISKKLEIYPGADKTSIMMILPHKPGSLYKTLSRFYALGINLIKLESRPLPNSDFEFMFYFDLDASVYEENFLSIFDGIDNLCVKMKYLGSYSEVV